MEGRWTGEQVLALAPDEASANAARRLAGSGRWSGTGTAQGLVWGLCAGSGRTPYKAVIDLDGPAFRCSCPSRKFPCKHALGLLLDWAGGVVPDVAEPVEYAGAWRADREARADRGASRDGSGVRDEAAAAKRAEQRESRVAAGLAELDIWLRDQVRTGLSAASTPGHTTRIAARMVDAQAAGMAGVLRRIGALPAGGDGWPARLLAEYGQLHLLVRAHERLGELPADLAATVRSRIGYPVSREDVLASPPVTDLWLVTGVSDDHDGTVPARRVWLRGSRTRRDALLLLFEPAGLFARVPGGELVAGMAVEADVHYYPGGPPLRAVLGVRHGEVVRGDEPATVDIGGLLESVAAALAADPWLTQWPGVVAGIPVQSGSGWLLADRARRTLPLLAGGDPVWTLAAVSGGDAVPVAGEWTPGGFIPLTCWHGGLAVRLWGTP